MAIWELIAVAIGLSMDAFAVSIGKGLAAPRSSLAQAAVAGAWFGGFQALMPVVGHVAGSRFGEIIQSVDHWVAFGLLALIGGKMIWESRAANEVGDDRFDVAAMSVLAVATSIDALAAGVSFAFLGVNIAVAASLIGAVTFSMSVVGVRLGGALGAHFRSRAELFGGIVLLVIGARILFEHLGA